ncbi:hypothetical protein L596_022065 [Steinernema carpocapsae]|uniref:Uncharacterized protein n=1 Tax=Steinernema carpocapsae TaxID=34508 RepID=A0A4U5MKL8_STECR|nr:hypothetical protein L596_022065 [Steinernema carpocapsae]
MTFQNNNAGRVSCELVWKGRKMLRCCSRHSDCRYRRSNLRRRRNICNRLSGLTAVKRRIRQRKKAKNPDSGNGDDIEENVIVN